MNTVTSMRSAETPSLPKKSSKKRPELSLCTVIFCLLVIFIHVSSEPVSAYHTDSFLFVLTMSLHRLSSFVVQGFLFLSGVKLFLGFNGTAADGTDGFSYRKFYLSRLKRVVLPYLAAVVMFYVYYIVTGVYSFSLPNLLRHIFLGDLVSHFYFVVIICQFYLLIPLWRCMAKRANPTMILIGSLILMIILGRHLPEILQVFGVPWFDHNHRLFTSYLFYFVLGVFAGLFYDRFLEMLRKQTTAVMAAWLITAAINCFFLYLIKIGKYYPYWLDTFHVLYCYLSILLSLTVADRICRTDFFKNILSKAAALVDKASYHVYLVHPIFIFFTDRVLNKFGMESISLRYLLRFLAVYALSLGMCFLWKRKRPVSPTQPR